MGPLLTLGFIGCWSSGPVFEEITEVRVRYQDDGGLVERVLTEAQLAKAKSCLGRIQRSTVESADQESLDSTWLLEVTDARGLRSFEMYTEHDLKGRDENYYRSDCLYKLAKEAGSDSTETPGEVIRGR
jgi:hypothetical protein